MIATIATTVLLIAFALFVQVWPGRSINPSDEQLARLPGLNDELAREAAEVAAVRAAG